MSLWVGEEVQKMLRFEVAGGLTNLLLEDLRRDIEALEEKLSEVRVSL